jgi:hypothetical protein
VAGGIWEVSMADLRETSNPERKAQIDIDPVGWLFAAFVVRHRGDVAYNGNDMRVANTPVSHVTGPHG